MARTTSHAEIEEAKVKLERLLPKIDGTIIKVKPPEFPDEVARISVFVETSLWERAIKTRDQVVKAILHSGYRLFKQSFGKDSSGQNIHGDRVLEEWSSQTKGYRLGIRVYPADYKTTKQTIGTVMTKQNKLAKQLIEASLKILADDSAPDPAVEEAKQDIGKVAARIKGALGLLHDQKFDEAAKLLDELIGDLDEAKEDVKTELS